MAVEWGQITERRCVLWNTTSRNWRTEGGETQRQNFTHVQCTSSHATSFSVERQKRTCSFRATDIHPKFLHVEFRVPVASWIALACFTSLYLCCIPLCMRDRKDWQSLETNSESHCRPHHRIRVSSCLPRWFQKTKRVGARRQPTHMSMCDFEATAPLVVLRNPSPCGTRRLCVSEEKTKSGRQTLFFTAGDLMESPIITPRVEEGRPRRVSYMLKWRVADPTVFLFDLKSAQDKGLQFWRLNQTLITLQDSMPSECPVKSFKWVKVAEEPEVLYRKIVLHPQPAPRVMLMSNQHQERSVSVPGLTDTSARRHPSPTFTIDIRCSEEPVQGASQEDIMTSR